MKKNSKRKVSIWRRIVGIVGYLFIFLILLLLVFVLVSKAKNNTVFIFGKTTAWVMTPSMEPTIPARSYILIEKIDPKGIKAGDVIIFESDDPELNSSFNTHRVVDVVGDNEEFITKGDANTSEDRYTAKAEKVLGRYVGNLPVLTAIGRFLFSGIGTLVAVTLILGIVMAMYLPDIIKANKKRAAEVEKLRQAKIEELVKKEVDRMTAENVDVGTLIKDGGGDGAPEAAERETPDSDTEQNNN